MTTTNQERTPTVKDTFASTKSKTVNFDAYSKFVSDLKTKFKLTDDSISNTKSSESYYNDLMSKINSTRSSMKFTIGDAVY